MSYEWDEHKRLLNLRKHGFDFADAVFVFESPHVVVPSIQDGDERRFLATGIMEGRMVTVVYTLRGQAVRIISMRRARHEERQRYQELYGGGA